MNTTQTSSHPSKNQFAARPVLTQAEKNTTMWIGHLQTDPTDHFGGQTFTSPTDGQLDNIQLYASAVHLPGDIKLSVHLFDPVHKTWGPFLGQATVSVQRDDHQQWIRFELPSIQLRKDETYGFRVQTPNAMIGLGEAACDNKHPFTFGHEWNGDSSNQQGRYYKYFCLAFKVEVRA